MVTKSPAATRSKFSNVIFMIKIHPLDIYFRETGKITCHLHAKPVIFIARFNFDLSILPKRNLL
jgi:hypothetical protein